MLLVKFSPIGGGVGSWDVGKVSPVGLAKGVYSIYPLSLGVAVIFAPHRARASPVPPLAAVWAVS